MCFPRCMGSNNSALPTEHGKHSFDFCNTSAVKRSKKRVLISLEGWSNSKYCLFPSVRMTFVCASYGAPRSFFHTLTRLYGEMRTFPRGVNWDPFWSPVPPENQMLPKKCSSLQLYKHKLPINRPRRPLLVIRNHLTSQPGACRPKINSGWGGAEGRG